MKAFKHLWLGILLILAASAILLLSDLKNRKRKLETSRQAKPSIALMQIASTPLLDSHVQGIKDALHSRGMLYDDERNLHIFNPQGDYTTANAIAHEMVNGNYDLLMTSSTVALQVVAKSNQSVKKKHVFGAVTYPQGAGVGISGTKPEDHPPYLAGIGTFQPVKRAFQIAHELNPEIRRVGVVWNPGEKCSEACMIEAGKECRHLGIKLVEATASGTSEVNEALRSLLAKKVDAIWIGGDTVAISALPMIVHKAEEAGIPVFTNDPLDAEKGALFGIGADYRTVGNYTGQMAADILEGKSPAEFPIKNVVPELFCINNRMLGKFSGWKLTPRLSRLAEKSKKIRSPSKPQRKRVYTVGVCYYSAIPIFETALEAFRKRLAELGLEEGKNLKLLIRHPSGDMSMLTQVVKSLLKENPDVIVPFSTPCLASVIGNAKDTNIVFAIVSAPLEAGAGRSLTDHLPNVTGVLQRLSPEKLLKLLQRLFPKVKRIGILYNPSEANSVKEIKELKKVFEPAGLKLELMPTFNSNEAAQNIQALLVRGIDLSFVIADSTTANALPSIIHACSRQGVPVAAEDSSLMGSGAVFSCSSSPVSNARLAAELVMRVLSGESPAKIPIAASDREELTLDLAALHKYNVTIPTDILKNSSRFYNFGKSRGSPASIALVNMANNTVLNDAERGLEAGLKDMGFRPGRDYKLKKFNAQGEMSQLPQLLDSAIATEPDLIVTVTTPALISAAKKIKDLPVVFTVASNPDKLGLFNKGRLPNICGVYDNPPIAQLTDMLISYIPHVKKIGIVYDPSQMNSVISVEKLRSAAKKRKLKLLEATAGNVSELSLATRSLVDRGAEALIVSADNTVLTGFPAVKKIADSGNVPVFTTDIDLMKQGAAGAIGNDYFEWGKRSGRMAALVLAGVPPEDIPLGSTFENIVIEPEKNIVSSKSKSRQNPE